MRVTLLLIVAFGVVIVLTARPRQAARPFGFGTSGAAAQGALEQRFKSLPAAERLRQTHRFLTQQPHVAGSARDRELADYVRDCFRAFGLEDVALTTHEVLLPWAEETSVEMIAPRTWRASMQEEAIAGDPDTDAPPALLGVPYHAFSKSGEVTAPLVYAGSGTPEDFDRLIAMGIDVRGKIVLVRYSVPYSYRGYKVFTAQQRGAAGILIYSDPADNGSAKGATYPDGPWAPPSHIERGGVVYDFLVPGDPLTPGWPSMPGAHRIDAEQAVSLPAIVSAPLSARDAQVLLAAMGGREAPADWRGALPLTYRIGGTFPVVRMRVRADDRIRPVWTVTGLIRGTERPDQVVILGNHRDAWTYGGVDPSSGTAALIELARTLGLLAQGGWRPKRSILFASWDAEEFALTSSTEWGEQNAEWLQQQAVAYLNVDSAASGPELSAVAVPALNQLIAEGAQAVRDPLLRIPLAAASRDRAAGNATGGGRDRDLVGNRLGSGSDYAVFLNFLGVPVADLSFRGPHGVYHSIYDTHQWVARIGDPGFRYHVAMVQLWGVIAMRLAGSDILPLDYGPYARRVEEYLVEIEADYEIAGELVDARRALAELGLAAAEFNTRREAAIDAPSVSRQRHMDRQLMQAERGLLDPAGLRGRPWYRHVVFAPKFTYEAEVLPAVAEAARSGDRSATRAATARLAEALRRAAAALGAE